MKIGTINIFIEQALQVHQNKYRYDKVIYKNSSSKVIITCPSHGDFLQSPNSHISRKSGCPLCAANKKLSTSEFIDKAILIHRNKYRYDKVIYKNSSSKVIITCPSHGDFLQNPNNHLTGQGCPKCKASKHIDRYSLSTSEFIDKAILIHQNKYRYDKVIYKNSSSKVIITCPSHGDFLQKPEHHLYNSAGCPICKLSRGEQQIIKTLHNMGFVTSSQVKIPECKNKRALPFDIGIIDLKTKKLRGLIEFQGIQHYFPIDYFGGKKKLKYTQTNDQIKKQFCENNNIPLLIINFKELNNLENILLTFLDKNID